MTNKRVYSDAVKKNMNRSRRNWDLNSGTITRTYRLSSGIIVAFDHACSMAGETKKDVLERLMRQYIREIEKTGGKTWEKK